MVDDSLCYHKALIWLGQVAVLLRILTQLPVMQKSIGSKEVLWLCDLPITSPEMHLEFSNDPTMHGDYRWPFDSDILQPNLGLHALKVGCKANAAFLETENRLCLTHYDAPNYGRYWFPGGDVSYESTG